MRKLSALLVLLALPACDAAGNVNDGPVDMGIVAGDNQIAVAGAEQLSEPVVAKMVRTDDGGITLNLVTPAYAQGTVVTGSPIPGAVVCSESVSAVEMEPFVPCTNTDESGNATFFYGVGTVAGDRVAEVRGTVEGEPAVFDSVVSTVIPGPIVSTGWFSSASMADGDSISHGANMLTDEHGNDIPYTMEATGMFTVVEIGSYPGVRIDVGTVVGDTSTVTFFRDAAPVLAFFSEVESISETGRRLVDFTEVPVP